MLDDLNVFRISMGIGNMVWNIVCKCKYFEKHTVGSQLIRAVDSIASNISEGYGRLSDYV